MPGARSSPIPAQPESLAPGEAVRRRPGGRTERIRVAVADAVLDLFRERQFAFSVADVADRAGVHRATVYRRWPTRGDLIAEALGSFFGSISIPDTGSWEQDIRALGSTLARFFSDPIEIGVIMSLTTDTDPLAGDVIIQHWSPIVDSMRNVVDRAKARGEVALDLDSGRLIEMLIGPFVVHTVLVRRNISRRHVQEIVDLVIRAGESSR